MDGDSDVPLPKNKEQAKRIVKKRKVNWRDYYDYFQDNCWNSPRKQRH